MRKELTFHPSLTTRQKAILRSKSPFLFLTGVAGTGKSYTALARGLKLLVEEEVEKIVIIRSAVPTRDMGFLPGTQEEKMEAFAAPYIGIINDVSPKFGYRQMLSKKLVEFHPTSYLRGVTFDNAYIVLDEYQNCSEHEMETVVTRVGEGSHMVVCGDSDQSDLNANESRGHHRIIRTLTAMPSFETHEFTVDDIVRSAFVREYFEAKAASGKPTFLSQVR